MLSEFVWRRKVKGWLVREEWNESSIYCPWNSGLELGRRLYGLDLWIV